MSRRNCIITAVLCCSFLFTLSGCSSGKEFTLSGTVEYTQYDINSQAAGMIISVAKAEGDTVQEGDVVANVDSSLQQTNVAQMEALVNGKETRLSEIKAGSRKELIRQAEAALTAAMASYNNVKNGASPDQVAQAQAAADAAGANEATAKTALDYTTQKYSEALASFNAGLITQDDLNDAKYAMDTAQGKYDAAVQLHNQALAQLSEVKTGADSDTIAAAQASVDEAQANLDMLKNGSTSYVIGEAQADLDAAKAQLDQANLLLDRFTIKASAKGIISNLNVSKGDMVNNGGYVATILDQNDQWMYVYVPQSKLKYVSIGQQITLKTSAWPGEIFMGTVTYIASEAEFTPKNIETDEAKENTVFKVKIKLEDSKHQLKSGMTMDAVIPMQ